MPGGRSGSPSSSSPRSNGSTVGAGTGTLRLLPASAASSEGTPLNLLFSPLLVRPELRGGKSHATANETPIRVSSRASRVARFIGVSSWQAVGGITRRKTTRDRRSLGRPRTDQLRLRD